MLGKSSCDKENKDQFYFQGKYFDNQEDFWKYVNEWGLLALNQETAERQMDTLKKEIIMNIFLRGIELKNIDFRNYVNKIFEFAMIQLDHAEDWTFKND